MQIRRRQAAVSAHPGCGLLQPVNHSRNTLAVALPPTTLKVSAPPHGTAGSAQLGTPYCRPV